MNLDDHRLLRHLVLAVLLKLALLTALWWTFVRDMRVEVGVEGAAAQIGATAPAQEN